MEALAAEPGRATAIALDYGAPSDGPEPPCDAFALRRISVDAHGRLSLCCQLSEYGFNEADVVADLRETRLPDAWGLYQERLAALDAARRPRPASTDPFDAFPCMRCARATGKTAWLADYPGTPWSPLATPRLVHLAPLA